MSHAQEIAFNAALQIVIATMTDNKTVVADNSGGQKVGEFFAAIYDKLLEISSKG